MVGIIVFISKLNDGILFIAANSVDDADLPDDDDDKSENQENLQ